MKLEWKWTIPNVLSLMRIALIPVFAVLYLQDEVYWSVLILFLSGVTDLFDGMIARKFNQITEIGKVLDPIADKLTQVTVVLCLAIRMPRLWPLLAVCFFKELMQSIGATLLMFRVKADVQPARWYGKVSTFVFYFAMGAFVAFPPVGETPLLFGWNMPGWLFTVLVVLVAVCMVFAFFQYAQLFVRVSRETRQAQEQASLPDDEKTN